MCYFKTLCSFFFAAFLSLYHYCAFADEEINVLVLYDKDVFAVNTGSGLIADEAGLIDIIEHYFDVMQNTYDESRTSNNALPQLVLNIANKNSNTLVDGQIDYPANASIHEIICVIAETTGYQQSSHCSPAPLLFGNVRFLKIKHAADVVFYFSGPQTGSQTAGLAYVVNKALVDYWRDQGLTFEQALLHEYNLGGALAVMDISLSSPLVFAHEMGHVLGIGHPREMWGGSQSIPNDVEGSTIYGHGYGMHSEFTTVLGYPSFFGAPRIMRYSDADADCQSPITQVPNTCGNSESADAVRLLKDTTAILAKAAESLGGFTEPQDKTISQFFPASKTGVKKLFSWFSLNFYQAYAKPVSFQIRAPLIDNREQESEENNTVIDINLCQSTLFGVEPVDGKLNYEIALFDESDNELLRLKNICKISNMSFSSGQIVKGKVTVDEAFIYIEPLKPIGVQIDMLSQPGTFVID